MTERKATARNGPHRSIRWPDITRRQVALASAYLGIDGERFISASIAASLLSMADHDSAFALALARCAGVDFDTLEKLTRRHMNGISA
jgi:hypothetical protein